MTIQIAIAKFFMFVDKEVASRTQRLQSFGESVAKDPTSVGPLTYKSAADNAWALDACNYVTKSKAEIVDEATFRMIIDWLHRDMICFASQYRTDHPEAPAYWHQIGRLEQEATRLLSAFENQPAAAGMVAS